MILSDHSLYHSTDSLSGPVESFFPFIQSPFDYFLVFCLLTILSIQVIVSCLFIVELFFEYFLLSIKTTFSRPLKNFVISFENGLSEHQSLKQLNSADIDLVLFEARLVWRKDLQLFLLKQMHQDIDPLRRDLSFRLYKELGFFKKDLKNRTSRVSWKRVRALKNLYFFSSLNIDIQWRDFLPDTHQEKVLYLMSSIKNNSLELGDLIFIFNSFKLSKHYQELPLHYALEHLPEKLFLELVFNWDALKSPRVRKMLLITCSHRFPTQARVLVDEAIEDTSMEVLVGVAKVMKTLKISRPQYIAKLLNSSFSEIRGQAVKLISLLEDRPLREKLTAQALHDQSSWVQYNVSLSSLN